MDGTFEPARNVQVTVRTDRHRCSVDDTRGKRLARPLSGHAKDGNGRFLTARSAVCDVQIAFAIEDGIVDLVKTCGPNGTNRNECRLTGHFIDTDRCSSALEVRRHHNHESTRRSKCDAGDGVAQTYFGQSMLDWKSRPMQNDSTTFDSAEGFDGSKRGPGKRRRHLAAV
jgi:hypothetical protein